ncbi:MAG: tRNA (adenosine(37)-N6)-dimethylallyltransferase MiaA [Candidatus Dormibacteria bacterium]
MGLRQAGAAAKPGATADTGPPVLAVVGPTATGKTALAVAIAERLGGCELVNADSRQVVRGLRVGTCAPTAAELRGQVCHLLDLTDPGADFTVADWLPRARACLADLATRGVRPIVVGGTGLYVRALLDGWILPAAQPDAGRRGERERRLAAPGGLEALVAELLRRDPTAAAVVDLPNPRRVLRALELLDAGPGDVQQLRRREAPNQGLRVALRPPAALHRRWIAERAGRMVGSGALVDECRAALARGVPTADLSRCGIGYREGLAILSGELGQTAASEAIAARTRRYAKAQRTWFRGDPATRWLDCDEALGRAVDQVVELVGGGLAA